MPRPPRDTAAGTFHVFTHVVWGYRSLFGDDADRLEFLRQLARVSATDGFTLVGFCLMENHHHLTVAVEDAVLPAAMRDLTSHIHGDSTPSTASEGTFSTTVTARAGSTTKTTFLDATRM